jgi:DNA-binding response OmpR family regulator
MYDILKSKNALYVEDDKLVLDNISKLLSNFFNNFFTASSAEEASEIYKNEKIDLLIVDIELPKASGIDFIKRIREADENIPIAIISAYTKTDYLLDSIELNLDKYIVKPFTTKKMYDLLKRFEEDFLSKRKKRLFKDLYIDIESSRVIYGDDSFELTQKELSFLDILATKKFISYDEIDMMWSDPPTYDAVRSFIKNLRKKLPIEIFHNRQNLGYYLDSENAKR